MLQTLFLLVDSAGAANDPELPCLLTFDGVEGLKVEQNVRIVEEGERSYARVGAKGTQLVSLSPLKQFRRFANEIAKRPGCSLSAELIERALAFSHLGSLLNVNAVVSPAGQAFAAQDAGLLRIPLLTVPQALAVLGAHVRQMGKVPLGGSPPIVQSRTEVYPLTARVIIPNGQQWWSSCVRFQGPEQEDVLGLGEAVFKRLGQALRARDNVHEALRRGNGRAAIIDSLYHLDVALTSSVASFDALARLAHKVFKVEGDAFKVGWQKEWWIKELRKKAPSLADLIRGPVKAQVDVLTSTRNSIHAIPLDEFLSIERGGHTSRVEHRAMLSADLADRLREVGRGAGNPENYGLFLGGPGPACLNLGQFTERLLEWSFTIVGGLLREMLSFQQFPPAVPPNFSLLDLRERKSCAALAQVGRYPFRTDTIGIPALPSLHQSVLGSIHRSLQQGRK